MLDFVYIAYTPPPLECLIRAEVNSKAGRVSNEHALVASEETLQPLSTVNASNFLAITHVLSLVMLGSYFQQVKYKGDVRVSAMERVI